MARYANIDDANGKRVDSHVLKPEDLHGHTFYCITENCEAGLFGYAIGGTNARFNSFCVNEHISSKCIGRDLEFDENQTSEQLFDLNMFSQNLCRVPNRSNENLNHPNQNIDISPIVVKNHPVTPVNTLYGIYFVCSKRGVNGLYNDIPINDFFACRDNYDEKHNGFDGFYIVETSFYHIIPYTKSMLFFYSSPHNDESVILRINFLSNEVMFDYYRRHFMNKETGKLHPNAHNRLIVVGGEWKRCNKDDECICECDIMNLRQLRFIV